MGNHLMVGGQAVIEGVMMRGLKGIATAGVGYQTEEIITAKIVDPGKRCFGSGDHVLTVYVIKITKFHSTFSLPY